MGLLEVIKKDLIIVPLMAKDKEGVIEALTRQYAISANLSQAEESQIVEEITHREMLGSTAMEHGIAIPHVKLDGIKKSAVVIGISRLPIDFGGAEKSRIFFLVLAPKDQPSEHIQILASIARLCSSDVFVRMLLNAKSKDEVYALFFD